MTISSRSCSSSSRYWTIFSLLLSWLEVLRFELYHDSPLSRFLLRRGLSNRRVGLALFWHLYVELETPELQERVGILLEAFCTGLGGALHDFLRQLFFIKRLDQIAANVAQPKLSLQQRINVLMSELQDASVWRIFSSHLISFSCKCQSPHHFLPRLLWAKFCWKVAVYVTIIRLQGWVTSEIGYGFQKETSLDWM